MGARRRAARTPGDAARPAPVVELRVDVEPPWPFRLRGDSPDGLFRRRGDCLQRLICVGGAPVLTGAAQLAPGRVRFAARGPSEAAAAEGIRRLRFATGVDDDLRAFHDAFRRDPLIGRSVRELPHLRPFRRPHAWEALAWAVTEQLIEFERAVLIQRRILRAFGPRCPQSGLRDVPAPALIAAQAPARLQSFDLAAARAVALRRAALEVARGRVDLEAPDHERGWRRLLAIPGIGPWTVEMLAVQGQGRVDQVPAGDLAYIKLVGRLTTGNPRARAEIPVVRAFFERYGPWRGLAAAHLLAAASRGWLPERPIGAVRAAA